MVEVFKTNVIEARQAEMIVTLLSERFPEYEINFDLADCDKILRVKNDHDDIESNDIISIVQTCGHQIESL